MGAADDATILTVRTRADLRNWPAAHHTDKGPVWLASFKRHHPDYLAHEPIVEELLCWDWIDPVTRALDADRARILIAPRNPNSAWSAINKAHVERARASGAMTPSGEAKIAAALANGQWSFLDDVERFEVPDDLGTALGVDRHPSWPDKMVDAHHLGELRPDWDTWPSRSGAARWNGSRPPVPRPPARHESPTR